MGFENKTAIITGGSRGIGKSTALLFAQNGYNVVINSRTQADVVSTVRELQKITTKVIGVKVDVSSSKDVKKLVDKTIREFHTIDILVNNAGILYQKPLIKMTEKEWDELIDTNLKGVFLCSKEVLPYMIKQKSGTIINISSGAGHYTFSNLAAYCASKSGVLAITKALSDEVKKHGIKVFSICPGPVATRMQEQIMRNMQYKIMKHLILKPEQIARKVLEVCLNKYKLRSGSCFDIYFS